MGVAGGEAKAKATIGHPLGLSMHLVVDKKSPST